MAKEGSRHGTILHRASVRLQTADCLSFGAWMRAGGFPSGDATLFNPVCRIAETFVIHLSMPATPSCANLLQSRRELLNLLLASHQVASHENQQQLISISLEINAVDPLAFLENFYQENQLHFYFEKPCQSVAIAAIDSVLHFQLEGQNRFQIAQQRIQQELKKIVAVGASETPFAGPHFFCGFTFAEAERSPEAPFPAATVFLPRWQVARHGQRTVLVANVAIAPEDSPERLADELWQRIQAIQAVSSLSPTPRSGASQTFQQRDVVPVSQFQASVRRVLRDIADQAFHKVVLAHAVDVTAARSFRLPASLDNLRRLYPDCHVFSMGNGRGQNFLGASPERLISIRQQRLKTDALAGSAPRGATPQEDLRLAQELRQSVKERHEHQLVLDFILQQLLALGLVPQRSPLPRILTLSNIQHLWTPIQAPVPPEVHPLEIVAALHPTPAVAGTPRAIACQQIGHHEPFARSLYAAPLGWVDYQGNSEFIVGIRSALLQGRHARLYAGVGIVAGSEPERELAEIKLKLQVLLSALV